jgi:hypothetical protein
MSGYMSLLLLIIGGSLIAVVGLIGLILTEVRRNRDDRRTDMAE